MPTPAGLACFVRRRQDDVDVALAVFRPRTLHAQDDAVERRWLCGARSTGRVRDMGRHWLTARNQEGQPKDALEVAHLLTWSKLRANSRTPACELVLRRTVGPPVGRLSKPRWRAAQKLRRLAMLSATHSGLAPCFAESGSIGGSRVTSRA